MSAKTEIYSIARDLRAYLEWQAKSGAAGSVPADAEQRAAFEAIEKRREEQQLAAARREIMGEEAPEPAKQRSAPPEQSSPAKKKSSPAKKKSAEPAKSSPKSDNPAENLRERFAAAAKEDEPTKTSDSDDSDDQPWKRFGSRPRPRFAAKKKKQEMADKSKSKSKRQQSNQKQQSGGGGGGGQGGPQYDENAYPEASGMMMEGAVDMGDPGGGNAPQAKQAPQKKKAEKKSKDDMTKAEKLEFLENYLGDCRRCGLCENRTNIVFGDGTAEARLVFVGEAPGYNEDKQGLPFVGDAGQLLNKMIEAMGLEREDVYICNVIKCRPPKNRNPHPDEIKECSPFLRKQLEVIAPEVIVSLGKFASQWLLESDDAMGRMRGTWHEWNGTPVMPTYHPAYLLRQESQKAKTWNDLQMVMERLGL